MSFVCFSFDPSVPHFRAIVTGILMNLSITFRWAFNQLIPSVSYLTNLDRYAFISFSFLVLLMIWHALIGSSLFSSTYAEKIAIEINFIYAVAALYVFFNLVYIIITARLFFFRKLIDKKLVSIDKIYGKFNKSTRGNILSILKKEKLKV